MHKILVAMWIRLVGPHSFVPSFQLIDEVAPHVHDENCGHDVNSKRKLDKIYDHEEQTSPVTRSQTRQKTSD